MQNLKCLIVSILCLSSASVILIVLCTPRSIAVSPHQQPDIWADYALLRRACSCESTGSPTGLPREYNANGGLLRGYPNPLDVGACQIHLPTWSAQAKKMGLHIETSLVDNIAMAKYIFSVQGMSAWKASKSCWYEKGI